MANVYEDILRERSAQDSEWGGAAHDDQHTPRDWLAYVLKQLGKAADACDKSEGDSYRERLVAVAALAVAAVEAHDRALLRELERACHVRELTCPTGFKHMVAERCCEVASPGFRGLDLDETGFPLDSVMNVARLSTALAGLVGGVGFGWRIESEICRGAAPPDNAGPGNPTVGFVVVVERLADIGHARRPVERTLYRAPSTLGALLLAVWHLGPVT